MEQTLNEKIGELLGFKKHIGKPGSGYDGVIMWEYPDDWKDEVRSFPETALPDFIQMIQDSREVAKRYRYGFPHEFSNHIKREKVESE